MTKLPGNRIDFHTHILPHMDDGSASAEMSVQMLCAQQSQGVYCVVLTPHFYAGSDYPEHFLEKRDCRLKELGSLWQNNLPLLIAGAEVQYFEGITSMRELPRMRIGRSPGLLIEMPFSKWTSRVIDDVLELNNRSEYRVILAHIERYLGYQNRSAVEKLAAEGILMQSNASFFTGRFSSGKALRLLDDGLIHLLGSDCHNVTSRKPDLEAACRLIEEKRGAETVKAIMNCGLKLLLSEAGKTKYAERH